MLSLGVGIVFYYYYYYYYCMCVYTRVHDCVEMHVLLYILLLLYMLYIFNIYYNPNSFPRSEIWWPFNDLYH